MQGESGTGIGSVLREFCKEGKVTLILVRSTLKFQLVNMGKTFSVTYLPVKVIFARRL